MVQRKKKAGSRSLLINTAISLLALFATLSIVEATLRATHLFGARLAWTEPDDQIAWRLTPGAQFWQLEENDHPIEGRINSLGWNDLERSRARTAGVKRVAVVGDSYVEALQVEPDARFTALAERALEERGESIEVWAFGRSGMTQTEELIVLERDVLPVAPDRVVLLFYPRNDIGDIARATANAQPRPFFELAANGSLVLDTSFNATFAYRIRKLINALKQHSALVSLVTERYVIWRHFPRGALRPGSRGEGRLNAPESLASDHPVPEYERNYALSKRLIREMAERCHERGIEFALMVVPLVYTPASIERHREIDPSFDPRFFEDDLSAFAREIGVDFIPLQVAFERAAAETGQSLNWAHWNYAGHRAAAGALAHALSGS